jgi:hypothetical protein
LALCLASTTGILWRQPLPGLARRTPRLRTTASPTPEHWSRIRRATGRPVPRSIQRIHR